MTKKDYILIADTLKPFKLILPELHMKLLINDFCTMLKQDNPLFSADKFISYINK